MNKLNVNIDQPFVEPGEATTAAIDFGTEDGTSWLEIYSGIFTSTKGMPADNSLYSELGVIINLGSGYDFRYNYKRRE